jgi:hypothetical protein
MTADETYWRELAAEWMNAEEPSRSEHQWRKLLSSSRPGREAMMEPHVREFVAQLPERIRVWRGAVRGLNERGFSSRSSGARRCCGRTAMPIATTTACR